MSIAEIIEKQNKVIRVQSDIIDELYLMLAQYATVEEMDSAGYLSDIQNAALMCQEIEQRR